MPDGIDLTHDRVTRDVTIGACILVMFAVVVYVTVVTY